MDILNILVVDDDRDFAEALTDVLEAEHHRVDYCHTGEDAVALFGRNNYDLSFMDVKLPLKNGVESFLEIRSHRPDARVVMMTGYSMEQLLEQAVEHGAWAVMHKPLNMVQVLELVDAIPSPSLVVIFDEEPEFIAALTSALAEEDLRAVCAEAGVDAVRMIGEGSSDLVILDMRSPHSGVKDVFEALNRQGLRVPSIIVTGETPDGDQVLESLRALARIEWLLKPCAPAAVARLAAAMLRGE